jgi:hypothetical protein
MHHDRGRKKESKRSFEPKHARKYRCSAVIADNCRNDSDQHCKTADAAEKGPHASGCNSVGGDNAVLIASVAMMAIAPGM